MASYALSLGYAARHHRVSMHSGTLCHEARPCRAEILASLLWLTHAMPCSCANPELERTLPAAALLYDQSNAMATQYIVSI
jgi:hypothetical protein